MSEEETSKAKTTHQANINKINNVQRKHITSAESGHEVINAKYDEKCKKVKDEHNTKIQEIQNSH